MTRGIHNQASIFFDRKTGVFFCVPQYALAAIQFIHQNSSATLQEMETAFPFVLRKMRAVLNTLCELDVLKKEHEPRGVSQTGRCSHRYTLTAAPFLHLKTIATNSRGSNSLKLASMGSHVYRMVVGSFESVVYAVLSEATSRMFKLIVDEPGISVGAMSLRTGMTGGNIYPPLRALHDAGLVHKDHEGMYRPAKHYSAIHLENHRTVVINSMDVIGGLEAAKQLIQTTKTLYHSL